MVGERSFSTTEPSVGDLLAERGKTHGDARTTAEAYDKLCDIVFVKKYPKAVRYSLNMMLAKLARIVCGDASCIDHWDDSAGYAVMAADRLREQEGQQS